MNTFIPLIFCIIEVNFAWVAYERSAELNDGATHYLRFDTKSILIETDFELGFSLCMRSYVKQYQFGSNYYMGYWPDCLLYDAREISFFKFGQGIFEGKVKV